VKYRVVREWTVEAENSDEALEKATPGTHTDVHVRVLDPPATWNANPELP
jgi:hypothetical protein